MLDGVFRNSTVIFFGESQFSSYATEVASLGSRFVLLSGRSSRLAGDVVQRVLSALNNRGCFVIEVADIRPGVNSKRIEEVISLARCNQVDAVIAVGGGTVIDAAKVVALGLCDPSPLCALFSRHVVPVAAAPLGVVLTLPGTGSESSNATTIFEIESGRKLDLGTSLIQPRVAYIEPEIALSAPVFQRAAGVVDSISHVFERYFTRTASVEVSTGLCESLLRSLVSCGVKLIRDPTDCDNAANIAWCAKLAHDSTLGFGRQQDWATHRISHAVESVLQSRLVHGELLAMLFPAWLDFVASREATWLDRLYQLDIFKPLNESAQVDEYQNRAAHPFVTDLRRFFGYLGMPARLDLGGRDPHVFANAVADEAVSQMRSGTLGHYVRLSRSDIASIVSMATGPHDD